MDYEKKYREALKKAEAFYYSATTEPITEREVLANIFPELQESEDERIRKELIFYLGDMPEDTELRNGVTNRDVLVWLEKQGEQKNFDYENANIQQKDFAPKQEPKFKVGDFIVNDYCMGKVIELTDDAYLLDTGQGIPFSCEHNVHLWSIQDAKDGDVLATKKGNPFIYDKNRYNNGLAYYYAGLDVNKELTLKSPHHMLAHFGELRSVFPATKEQRDTLMKAMADAGYTFDFEKKELKKIEQRPSWSEEDKKMFVNIKACLRNVNKDYSREVDWLKSLKDRHTWKPSDEQMRALHDMNLTGNISYAGQGQTLIELYNDLKKLKGD